MIPAQSSHLNGMDFDDIFDLWQPVWWERPLVWISIIVIAGLIGGMIVFFVRWHKARQTTKDPYVELYQSIKTIRMRSLDEKEQFICLKKSIKQFFESLFDVQLQGCTEYELLRFCKKQKIHSRICELIADLLSDSVDVCFARKEGACSLDALLNQLELILQQESDRYRTPSKK